MTSCAYNLTIWSFIMTSFTIFGTSTMATALAGVLTKGWFLC